MRRQNPPSLWGVVELLTQGVCVVHRLGEGIAVLVCGRPVYPFLVEVRKDDRVLQRRIGILGVGRRAADPHEPRGPVWRPRLFGRLGPVADRVLIELQPALGQSEAGVVMEDREGDGLAEKQRRLALVQQERTVEVGLHHRDAVAGEIGGRHQHVRLQVRPQYGQVEPLEDPVAPAGADQQGVRLPVRPTRHVAGPDIHGEDLLARHLGNAVAPEPHPASADPVRRLTHGADLHVSKDRAERHHRNRDPRCDGPKKAAP